MNYFPIAAFVCANTLYQATIFELLNIVVSFI